MNSKKKGSGGERELLGLLEEHGASARRNDQRYIGGEGNPDVAAEIRGIPLHIEVKRTERLRLHEALQQAEHDAAGRIPAVVFRGNREPWRLIIKLDDFLKICHDQ